MICVLILPALLVSCALDAENEAELGVLVQAELGNAAEVPPEVETIELTVSGAGMDPIHRRLLMEDLDADEQVRFVVEVSAGERTFSIGCLDADDFGLYRGEQTITLKSGDNKDLSIELQAYGLVGGHVWLPDAILGLVPSPDFNMDETEVVSGLYQLEIPVGDVNVVLDPGELLAQDKDFWGFTRVPLSAAGEEAEADIVLVDRLEPQFAALPWLTGVYPHIELSAGESIDLYGIGFNLLAGDLTVWFDDQVTGENLQVIDEGHLSLEVPAGTPASGMMKICLNAFTDCSNLFPYSVAP